MISFINQKTYMPLCGKSNCPLNKMIDCATLDKKNCNQPFIITDNEELGVILSRSFRNGLVTRLIDTNDIAFSVRLVLFKCFLD